MEITELIGKTLKTASGRVGDPQILFETTEGERYRMFHDRDCCESVLVEDICGDMQDLVGSPIVQAEANSSTDSLPGATKPTDFSFLWTFYRLATSKGQVVIRWLGESNGYYSESVEFERILS